MIRRIDYTLNAYHFLLYFDYDRNAAPTLANYATVALLPAAPTFDKGGPIPPQCRRPLPSPKLDFVKKFTIANHVVNYFTSTKPTKKTPVKVSISVWVIVMPRYPKHKGRKEPRRIPSSVGHHSYLTFDSGYYLNHWRATTHKSTF